MDTIKPIILRTPEEIIAEAKKLKESTTTALSLKQYVQQLLLWQNIDLKQFPLKTAVSEVSKRILPSLKKTYSNGENRIIQYCALFTEISILHTYMNACRFEEVIAFFIRLIYFHQDDYRMCRKLHEYMLSACMYPAQKNPLLKLMKTLPSEPNGTSFTDCIKECFDGEYPSNYLKSYEGPPLTLIDYRLWTANLHDGKDFALKDNGHVVNNSDEESTLPWLHVEENYGRSSNTFSFDNHTNCRVVSNRFFKHGDVIAILDPSEHTVARPIVDLPVLVKRWGVYVHNNKQVLYPQHLTALTQTFIKSQLMPGASSFVFSARESHFFGHKNNKFQEPNCKLSSAGVVYVSSKNGIKYGEEIILHRRAKLCWESNAYAIKNSTTAFCVGNNAFADEKIVRQQKTLLMRQQCYAFVDCPLPAFGNFGTQTNLFYAPIVFSCNTKIIGDAWKDVVLKRPEDNTEVVETRLELLSAARSQLYKHWELYKNLLSHENYIVECIPYAQHKERIKLGKIKDVNTILNGFTFYDLANGHKKMYAVVNPKLAETLFVGDIRNKTVVVRNISKGLDLYFKTGFDVIANLTYNDKNGEKFEFFTDEYQNLKKKEIEKVSMELPEDILMEYDGHLLDAKLNTQVVHVNNEFKVYRRCRLIRKLNKYLLYTHIKQQNSNDKAVVKK